VGAGPRWRLALSTALTRDRERRTNWDRPRNFGVQPLLEFQEKSVVKMACERSTSRVVRCSKVAGGEASLEGAAEMVLEGSLHGARPQQRPCTIHPVHVSPCNTTGVKKGRESAPGSIT